MYKVIVFISIVILFSCKNTTASIQDKDSIFYMPVGENMPTISNNKKYNRYNADSFARDFDKAINDALKTKAVR
jgi:hypothetical protein